MNDKSLSFARRASRFVTFAMLAVIVLSVVASLLYAGGNVINKTAAHYSWHYNFYSDLSITKTYLEKSNVISMVVADVALVLTGLAIIVFSGLQKVLVARRGRLKGLAENSVILALFAGLGFVALALLPWNLHLELHLNLIKITYLFAAIYALCVLVVQWANRWPLVWRLLSLVYLAATIGYLLVVFNGPALDTLNGITTQAAAQKAIFFATFVYFGLEAWGIRRSLRRVSAVTE